MHQTHVGRADPILGTGVARHRQAKPTLWLSSSSIFFCTLFFCTLIHAAFNQPEHAQSGMVASAHPLATKIGVKILQQGGNAIDAAVAVSFVISVVEPFSAGIGGGGFLVHFDAKSKKVRTLDFRERAPAKASRDMYLDETGKPINKLSVNGHKAVAVPGTVAGLFEVHKLFGKFPWKKVIAPAYQLAKDGFEIDWNYVRHFEWRKNALKKNGAAWKQFSKNGKAHREGDILRQPGLAKTLEIISKNPDDFYEGKIAKAIANDMKKHGGLITLADLKSYKPIWRKPVCGKFENLKLCSMPPPSSGGVVLLEILNILQEANPKNFSWHDPKTLHLMAEAMRTAYADRAVYLGDPDFVDIPIHKLVSKRYAKRRFAEINHAKARNSQSIEHINSVDKARLLNKYESPQTTHLNVVDKDRNAVSLTFTVNYNFGAAVSVPGYGILLNNEMDDFSIAPGVPNLYGLVGAEANSIAPNKTPLSSMTPVIALKDGRLKIATGSPGGSRIISTSLQILLNSSLYNMDASAAVASPRIHHQWLPDELFVEKRGLDPNTIKVLKSMGHKIKERSTWGNASAIFVQNDGQLQGAADPRGYGTAMGY